MATKKNQSAAAAATATVMLAKASEPATATSEFAWPGQPVMTSTVLKTSYVLGSHPETDKLASKAYAAKVQADEATAAFKLAADELRAYGVAARTACAVLHGGDLLPSVKVPFKDAAGAAREAMVTVSQSYSINEKILEQRDELGGVFDACIETRDVYTLAPKGLDILRGLLANAGLKGHQIESAVEQICEKKVVVSVTDNYEVVHNGVPDARRAVLDKFIVRAKASVKV